MRLFMDEIGLGGGCLGVVEGWWRGEVWWWSGRGRGWEEDLY